MGFKIKVRNIVVPSYGRYADKIVSILLILEYSGRTFTLRIILVR